MLDLYGHKLSSRLLLGTALYPSPSIMAAAVKASGAEIVTVSLRRETAGGKTGGQFWALVQSLGVRVLSNTAGCHSVREAVTTAHIAREAFGTNWIKLGLVEAAKILVSEGFEVLPYTTDDRVVAERLLDAGCQVLMPWCAPIGSARRIQNPDALRSLRGHFSNIPLNCASRTGTTLRCAGRSELRRRSVTAMAAN